MGDPILLNGYAYDYASIRVRIDGQVEHRIKSLDVGDAMENATYLYGTSRYPIGRTRGQYKPKESSLEFYRVAWDERVGSWADQLYTRLFTIEIERSELGSPFTKDVLLGCSFKSQDHSHSEGGDPLTVKVGLVFMVLRTNGKNPLPNMSL
jgi:hypothetical protein